MIMKKIIIFNLFLASALFCRSSLAAYPETCSVLSQGVLDAVGGCSSIDCYSLSNICEKCCPEKNPTVVCSNFSYSDWSNCQPNGIQTRTIISKSPAGCVGGVYVTSQSCIAPASTETLIASTTASVFTSAPNIANVSTSTAFLTPVFTVSKNEIESGEAVTFAFLGDNVVSKYTINFTCPKFSFGSEAGFSAASVKIDGIEYCNRYFAILASAKTKNATIINKASNDIKISVRLNAFNSQEQYIGYNELGITIQKKLSINTASSTSASTSLEVIPIQKPISDTKIASSSLENNSIGSDISSSTASEMAATSTQKTEPIIALIDFIKNIFIGIFKIFRLGN
ncbi:MAG: hypothetical protein ACYC3G_03200 [Minisyncoccota bacterium]